MTRKSKEKLPLESGNVVTLSCVPGYRMQGSDLVTCVGGEQFTQLPTCLPGIVWHILLILKNDRFAKTTILPDQMPAPILGNIVRELN